MLLRYLYTISKLCASISNLVLFDIGVSLSDPAWAALAPTRYWTQNAVCTLRCESIIARGACAAMSRRSRGCTRRRGRTGRTGRSTGRSRRSALGTAEYVELNLVPETGPESPWPSRRSARFPSRRIVNHNHGLNNGSSQSSHAGGALVMPDTRNHQRNAGACDSILRENDGLAPSLECRCGHASAEAALFTCRPKQYQR